MLHEILFILLGGLAAFTLYDIAKAGITLGGRKQVGLGATPGRGGAARPGASCAIVYLVAVLSPLIGMGIAVSPII
ncbi:hypothetical protein [Hyphomonas sp.]|uniref:hypothetical protein n=1 Tax=Hyphomonas sp. TaxID=87 RepID=UPI0032D943CA